MVKLDEE
jgi:hypothetical protein